MGSGARIRTPPPAVPFWTGCLPSLSLELLTGNRDRIILSLRVVVRTEPHSSVKCFAQVTTQRRLSVNINCSHSTERPLTPQLVVQHLLHARGLARL